MKRVMLMMVLAALLLTQCRRPSIEFPSAEVSMTVTAGPGSKTDISTEGGIVWSTGDKLYVGCNGKYAGCLSIVSGVGSPTGTFTGTVTGVAEGTQSFHFFYLGNDNGVSPEVGDEFVSITSFAEQDIYADGGKLKNANRQHVGYGTASGKVDGGYVIGVLDVAMKSKVAIAYFHFESGETPTPYEGALTLSGDHIYNSMTVGFGGTFSPGTKGDISIAGGHAGRYVMLVPPENVANETLNFSGSATGATALENGIEANKFYRVDGSMPIVVKVTAPSYLPGEFTTNSGGTKVKFSKGNLYYDGTTDNKWKFEANQYDFRTYNGKGSCINGTYNSGSGTPSGDWGLFGWSGSNQTHYGKNTSQNNSDYSGGKLKDWGDITDLPPAGEGNTWRTLSKAEWVYLMNTRTASPINGTSDARYAEVKVNGVCGMMLFPDTFTWPSDVTTKPTTFNKNSLTWNDGVDYSTVDFGKLESAGVVFLPAVGRRTGTDVDVVGSRGLYWSSTPYLLSDAYYMYFTAWGVDTDADDRYLGYSVRLVRSAS